MDGLGLPRPLLLGRLRNPAGVEERRPSCVAIRTQHLERRRRTEIEDWHLQVSLEIAQYRLENERTGSVL